MNQYLPAHRVVTQVDHGFVQVTEIDELDRAVIGLELGEGRADDRVPVIVEHCGEALNQRCCYSFLPCTEISRPPLRSLLEPFRERINPRRLGIRLALPRLLVQPDRRLSAGPRSQTRYMEVLAGHAANLEHQQLLSGTRMGLGPDLASSTGAPPLIPFDAPVRRSLHSTAVPLSSPLHHL